VKKNIVLLVALGLILASLHPAEAQQTAKMRKMGFGASPWRPLRLCASRVLKFRFLNEVSEGENKW
jgi:hypothetical protein